MCLLAALALSTALAAPALTATPDEIARTCADLTLATFQDSLTTAEGLQRAVAALIATPSEATLQAAREARLAARVPHQQTEAFRFGNPIVADWEGRVHAWPLDGGLIDDTSADYGNAENVLVGLNVIATPSFTRSGTVIDATRITPALIRDTPHEVDGMEANVASGYHAIEFLLWGQDLNGTGPGAGAQPHSEFAVGEGCTGGNCDRRAAYLRAATDLLVANLEVRFVNWAETGPYRAAVTADLQAKRRAMPTGTGSLSCGELAGERMKLGLMLNDPEEPHDSFSDNTRNSHYYDGLGIRNLYLGFCPRIDRTVYEGPPLSDLVAAADPAVDARLRAELDASVADLGTIKSAADRGLAHDRMLAAGDARGKALIMGAPEAPVTQTASITRAVAALGLPQVTFEGSDSLDNPNAVFQ